MMFKFRRSAPQSAPKPPAPAAPVLDPALTESRKARARAWFEALRDDICTAFEALEDEAPTWLYKGDPGRFVRTPWNRTDHTGAPGGGGVMAMMHGRLFEKVGVHVQTILKLESGTPGTSLATMLLVLKALGMAADIDAIAAVDPLA